MRFINVLKSEGLHLIAVWRNGGFSASYDSFVSQQTVLLHRNIFETEAN